MPVATNTAYLMKGETMTSKHVVTGIGLLFVLVTLAACGGGGGGGGGVAQPPTSSACAWDSSTWDNCNWGS